MYKGFLSFFIFLLILIFVFLYIIISYHLGADVAIFHYKHEQTNDFPSYPRVKVFVKSDVYKEHFNDWKSGCYRLLLKNNGNIYIFYSSRFLERVGTFVIPNSKIESVQILPFYSSCTN